MGTQVLAGSKGHYQCLSMKHRPLEDFEFTVTHDTCLEAESVPVKFKDAPEGCLIPMKKATFAPDAQYKDY